MAWARLDALCAWVFAGFVWGDDDVGGESGVCLVGQGGQPGGGEVAGYLPDAGGGGVVDRAAQCA